MCGIAGRYNWRSQAPASRLELERMAGRMVHRGPDGDGFFVDGDLGLAHRRLAVIDVTGGAQPMASHDGSLVISYNGEVYNYLELFAELRGRGHQIRTTCDTEAVLLAYAEWGLDFPSHLNGMFAIALWDAPRRRLVLCRDRLGIKPLYYADVPGGLVFASELKTVRCAAGVDTSLDLEALDEYMTLGYVVNPRTPLRGVRKLEPGCLLSIEPGRGVTERRYWRLQFAPDQGPGPAEWAEQVRALFDDAVRLQLRSDVPLGLLLSGGLDSTAVATSMAGVATTHGVDTFCVGVDVPGAQTEFAWARGVAERLGTRHHEQRLTSEENAALLIEAARHCDEPLVEPMMAQLLAVCRLAGQHVKVVLSGEGSDETWFGYSSYRLMYGIEMAHKIVPDAVLRRLVGVFDRVAGTFPVSSRMAKYLRLVAEPIERRYLGLSGFDLSVKDRVYSPAMRQALLGHDGRESVRRLYDEAGGPELLSRMAAVDCRGWLVDNTLLRSDSISMAASIELRVPFLDHRLVELAARVPARYKIQANDQKVILKRALADRLPPEIMRRRKVGFPTPLAELLRGNWGEDAADALLAGNASTDGLFDKDVIRQLIDEHRARRNDWSRVIFQVLMLEYWLRAADDRLAVERSQHLV